MLKEGWIKLHREIQGKPAWSDATPEQKVVMITLLLMANYEEKDWVWAGKKVKIMPGQMITSLPSIAKAAGQGITDQKVRTALSRLEKLDFLTDESTHQGRLITITNWNTYQEQEEYANRRSNRLATDEQQTSNRRPNSNVRNKEIKKNKNTDMADDESFDLFWDAYPRKIKKKDARKAWEQTAGERPEIEKILQAVREQAASRDWQQDAGKWIPYPASWIRGNRWEDARPAAGKTGRRHECSTDFSDLGGFTDGSWLLDQSETPCQ